MITIDRVTYLSNGDIALHSGREMYSLPRKQFEVFAPFNQDLPAMSMAVAIAELSGTVEQLQREISELKERIANHG